MAGADAGIVLRIDDVSKRYGAATALDRLSLAVPAGGFFALLGPSGCGKTTLLRMIAGFEQPDSGTVFIDGEDMTDVPPHRRPVNMMFQSYALFPHMDVARNIGFGLVEEGCGRAEMAARVGEMLTLVQLDGLEKRRPHELSGGQRQRVALARALVKRPKILLLDEPLAALDRRLREDTQFELMHLQSRLATTFIVVTHDQREAMVMASRLALMRDGRVEQEGSAADLYERPASRYVADFIGEASFLDGRIAAVDDGGAVVDTAVGKLRVAARAQMPGAAVALVLRPERLRLRASGEGGANVLQGLLEDDVFVGNENLCRVRVQPDLVVKVARRDAPGSGAALSRGDAVAVEMPPASIIVVPA